MTVVSDTGPLIALAKIEALHLLRDLYRQVVTGPTVYTEAVTAGMAMNAADALAFDLVQALKGRPDVWLTPALCEVVIKTLQRLR